LTRWIVYKHRFLYAGGCRTKQAAEPCTLEFIVSVNGKTISEKTVKKTVIKLFEQIGHKCKDYGVMNPVYDFGELTWNEIMDDMRKLFIVDFPKRTGTKVQLWLEKSDDTAIWDDGSITITELPRPDVADGT